MFFSWLRKLVKDAVLAGCEDAAAEIAGPDDPSPVALLLRQRLQALPAPAEDGEPAARKQKAK